MVRLNDIDALYTAAEKANGIKWMTVSGIVVWVPYRLQLKISNVNIFIISKELQFLMKITYIMRPHAIK